MFVLITYDVNTVSPKGCKRLRRVAKECLNYGQRVQNSVFECVLEEAQFIFLKSKIDSIIDQELDNVRFYFLGKNWERKIVTLGKSTSYNVNSDLII
jgi:CRISPR-associated protein Cas2